MKLNIETEKRLRIVVEGYLDPFGGTDETAIENMLEDIGEVIGDKPPAQYIPHPYLTEIQCITKQLISLMNLLEPPRLHMPPEYGNDPRDWAMQRLDSIMRMIKDATYHAVSEQSRNSSEYQLAALNKELEAEKVKVERLRALVKQIAYHSFTDQHSIKIQRNSLQILKEIEEA